VCVVYDVLREPIDMCMEKWPTRHFGSSNLRKLLRPLLQGLDYLHTECHVVHTDLKPDNIMMGLGSNAILDHVVQDETNHPSPRKMPDTHGRIIYQSRSDFGEAPTDAVIASAKITDIGLAAWGNEHQERPIQSNAFGAPEVILMAGWSYPADIWNLGVMLWDLFENFGLFDAIDTNPSHYRPEQHLGLMIALLGPPPKALLDRGAKSATYFDEEGRFRHPKLVPHNFSFESSVSRFQGENKAFFIDFAKKMICWLPEDRWTAKQLLEHAWLMERDTKQSSGTVTPSRLEEDAKQSPGTVTPSRPEEDAKQSPGTVSPPRPEEDAKGVGVATMHSDSDGTYASPSALKKGSNASSQELIRAILDRKG
jgi:serine/threonine-protein kinase SRPK3